MSTAENMKEELKEQVNSVIDILSNFYSSYKEKNSLKLRVLDSFIVYNFVLLVLQMLYMVIVGNFPKNSFLSGIICCIGTMALTAFWRYNQDKITKNLLSVKPAKNSNPLGLLNRTVYNPLQKHSDISYGKSYQTNALRLKSDMDLKVLWYVLLKEKLFFQAEIYQSSQRQMISNRLIKAKQLVQTSMHRVKGVVEERLAHKNHLMRLLEMFEYKKQNYTAGFYRNFPDMKHIRDPMFSSAELKKIDYYDRFIDEFKEINTCGSELKIFGDWDGVCEKLGLFNVLDPLGVMKEFQGKGVVGKLNELAIARRNFVLVMEELKAGKVRESILSKIREGRKIESSINNNNNSESEGNGNNENQENKEASENTQNTIDILDKESKEKDALNNYSNNDDGFEIELLEHEFKAIISSPEFLDLSNCVNYFLDSDEKLFVKSSNPKHKLIKQQLKNYEGEIIKLLVEDFTPEKALSVYYTKAKEYLAIVKKQGEELFEREKSRLLGENVETDTKTTKKREKKPKVSSEKNKKNESNDKTKENKEDKEKKLNDNNTKEKSNKNKEKDTKEGKEDKEDREAKQSKLTDKEKTIILERINRNLEIFNYEIQKEEKNCEILNGKALDFIGISVNNSRILNDEIKKTMTLGYEFLVKKESPENRGKTGEKSVENGNSSNTKEKQAETNEEAVSLLSPQEKLLAESLKQKIKMMDLLPMYVQNTDEFRSKHKKHLISLIQKSRSKSAGKIVTKELAAIAYQAEAIKKDYERRVEAKINSNSNSNNSNSNDFEVRKEVINEMKQEASVRDNQELINILNDKLAWEERKFNRENNNNTSKDSKDSKDNKEKTINPQELIKNTNMYQKIIINENFKMKQLQNTLKSNVEIAKKNVTKLEAVKENVRRGSNSNAKYTPTAGNDKIIISAPRVKNKGNTNPNIPPFMTATPAKK